MGEEIQQGGRSAANIDQWVRGYSKEGEALQTLQTKALRDVQQGGRSDANVTDQWVRKYNKEGEVLQTLQTNA